MTPARFDRCFICAGTGLPLASSGPAGESAGYEFWEHEGLPFSRGAYFERFGDRCYFCEEPCVEDQRVTSPLLTGADAVAELKARAVATVAAATNAAGDSKGASAEGAPPSEDASQDGELAMESADEVVECRRVYHPGCLFCVATGKSLGGGGQEGEGEGGEEEEVFLGDDDGLPYCADAYLQKFRAASALTGVVFGDGEEIFLTNGLPISQTDLTDLFHEHWCAGCGLAITGKLQVTPTIGNFKWHPECLDSFKKPAAGNSDIAEGELRHSAAPLNPFEVDKRRKDAKEAMRESFKEKVLQRKVERIEVLAAAKARAKGARKELKKKAAAAAALLVQEEEPPQLQPPPQPQVPASREGMPEENLAAQTAPPFAPEGAAAASPVLAKKPSGVSELSREATSPGDTGGGSAGGEGPVPTASPLLGAAEEAEESAKVEATVAFEEAPSGAQDLLQPPLRAEPQSAAPKRSSTRRATMSSECQGYIWKQGGGSSLFGSKSWKKRWFVLRSGGVLTYYKDQQEWIDGKSPLKDALYKLKNCNVNEDQSKDAASAGMMGFVVQPRNAQGGPRRLLLRVESEGERARWITALSFKK